MTGLGIVSPLGVGVKGNWEQLTKGVSGVRSIRHFAVDDLPCRIAGLVPQEAEHPFRFDPDSVVPKKERRRMDDFIVYGVAAAEEAIRDSVGHRTAIRILSGPV